MISAFSPPDSSILGPAYNFLISRSEFSADDRKKLVDAGALSIVGLLHEAISILQDKTKGKNEDNAERIAKPLIDHFPQEILSIVMAIEHQLIIMDSEDMVEMLHSGKYDAMGILFDSLFHSDIKIRFAAGLTLLEAQLSPFTMKGGMRIKNEAQNLLANMQQNPNDSDASINNMLLTIYAAILYRVGDSQGKELLEHSKRMLLEDDRNLQNIPLEEYINKFVKDMSGYALFKLCFEANG
jgi:hypothetical protein